MNNNYLFIGTGFLGTAFLDAYHAVVTSAFISPYLPSLIPCSWVASRQLLSIMLFVSWIAWLHEQRHRDAGHVRDVEYSRAILLRLIMNELNQSGFANLFRLVARVLGSVGATLALENIFLSRRAVRPPGGVQQSTSGTVLHTGLYTGSPVRNHK